MNNITVEIKNSAHELICRMGIAEKPVNEMKDHIRKRLPEELRIDKEMKKKVRRHGSFKWKCNRNHRREKNKVVGENI